MPIKKYISRVEQFDQLIRLKSTGTPLECAEKLNISKRALYELITELKENFEFPIEYNRAIRSFVYSKMGEMRTLNFETNQNDGDYL